jgi:hypothetical protein
MFKIVYPICCGIDVHKTFVVATSAATDKKNITTCITQRFSTFTKDRKSLAQWLSDHSGTPQVCQSDPEQEETAENQPGWCLH